MRTPKGLQPSTERSKLPAHDDITGQPGNLVLTRKSGESIIIDEQTVITVQKYGSSVRLHIRAPQSVAIRRAEIEPKEAARVGDSDPSRIAPVGMFWPDGRLANVVRPEDPSQAFIDAITRNIPDGHLQARIIDEATARAWEEANPAKATPKATPIKDVHSGKFATMHTVHLIDPKLVDLPPAEYEAEDIDEALAWIDEWMNDPKGLAPVIVPLEAAVSREGGAL